MIRSFSLSDLERILEIEREAFPKSPYDWATFISLHYLYPGTFWVYMGELHAQEEEKILGYVVFSLDGHIISIAVDPRFRRKGIGRELLLKVMIHPGIRRLKAEVRRSNTGAQAFYSRLGFRAQGVIPGYYGNEDALVMTWTRV
jgi:ribosomal-protein-alanine N-acetyltransferase